MLRSTCLLVLVVSCSSEPVGHSSQPWNDACKIENQTVDTTYCQTLYYLKCPDGSSGLYTQSALAANYVGQWCLRENGQTYYYVCGINDHNEAWVYCDYAGQ